jgi:peptidyl-prolyl cis-trans isomerase A (cyclophilin A)
VVSVETPPALNRFDDSSNQLILNVDAGSAGIFQIAFSVETQDPQVIVRALPTSLSPKATVEAGFSTFNEATGQLTIPELEVSGQVAYRNLILSLTDSAQLLFTLQSFETP